MRFRITRGGPAAQLRFDRTAKPVVKPQPENPVSLAQALDNPYGRYYGKARAFGKAARLKMAAAFALAIIRGNNIFIFVSPKRLRSFRRYFFQGKSCNGNRHRSTQFIAQATFKSAKHKKSFSVATWIFCMEPFCFGIIKGEQPLIRASRASKVAGAFLVLFCACKRVHIRRRRIL